MISRLGVTTLALALLVALPARAQWQPDGVEVCAASSTQNYPVMVSDGAGGAVIAWRDVTRNGYYAQRLDAAGVPQWNASGVRISDLPAVSDLRAVYDGFGGIIVTWSNGTDVLLQKVTVNGTLAWGSAGVDVCSGEPNQRQNPQIISDNLFSPFVGDPSPGAIVVWQDSRNGIATSFNFAQSINGDGVPRWTADGVLVSTDTTGNQDAAYLVTDGTTISTRLPKGAIIGWDAIRGGNSNVYAQRLNSAGVRQWTNPGMPVSTASGDELFTGAIAFNRSGNATLIWEDGRNGDHFDLYGNREGPAGEWAVNGRPVAPVTGLKDGVVAANDGLGGVIVAWSDERSGSDGDIYVQRMDASGNPLWGTTGTPIAVGPDAQVEPVVVPDAVGGTFLAYVDYGAEGDLFAQHVDSTGTTLWNPPVPVCTAAGDRGYEAATSDGSGGFIVAWRDGRGGAERIYAQHVSASGGVVAALAAAPTTLRLAAPFPNPTRGAMFEKFELPKPERVSAGIFDVAGRLVCRLAQDEPLGAGPHEMRWDGLDRKNEKVAAGVYLFELSAGEERGVERELVIR
jgi:hypothetical protein